MLSPRLRFTLPKALAAFAVTVLAAGSSLVFFVPVSASPVRVLEKEKTVVLPERPTPHETEGVHKPPPVPRPPVTKRSSAKPTNKALPRHRARHPRVRPSASPRPVPVATPTPTATPIPTSTPAPIPVNPAIRAQVILLINQQRAAVGAGQLASSSALSEQCQAWTAHMAATQNMVHSDLPSGGEIIAMGYNTAADVVQGWLDSPPHKAIMLDPRYTEIGSGFLNGYWTVQFG